MLSGRLGVQLIHPAPLGCAVALPGISGVIWWISCLARTAATASGVGATLPARRRNLMWMMFAGPRPGAGTRHWEPAARAVLSQFRIAASQRPDDPRFAELITALGEASPQFREWWAEYPVRSFRPVTIVIDHPAAGPVAVELYQLRMAERPDITLVLQVPASAADLRRVTAVLDAAAAARSR